LRNIHEKYGIAYQLVEGERVDLKAYCTKELELAQSARAAYDRHSG